MKVYTIIAGVNGVGKSSLTGVLSRVRSDLGMIIDTDSIEATPQIETCLDAGVNFTQETTLSGVRTLKTVQEARARDYRINLYYVAVSSAEESLERIANRVRKGGHDIPEEDVRRRYNSRFADLLKILPYCDTAQFYDNENGFQFVAEFRNGALLQVGGYCPKWLSELSEKLVLAWDSDFTKVTEAEREQIKHAEESGFVSDEDIDWDDLQKYDC